MTVYWTPKEVDQLLEMAGDIPGPLLSRHYNQWAVVNGYKPRTNRALIVKASKCGCSIAAVGSWITTGGIAKILGLRPSTVESWTNRFSDFPKVKAKQYYYIKRTHLKSWACDHMQLFGGIAKHRLVQLFEDEALADLIAEHYPKRPRQDHKPVECITTSTAYPSISAASRATFITRAGITKAIHANRSVCGLYWRFTNEQRLRSN